MSGPLFRDESPQAQTYDMPQTPPYPAAQQNPEPMPDAPQPAPPPQKKSAGRDLGAAIGVGVGLGVVIIASLFVVKAAFVGVVAVAVVVGLWELTSRLQERKGIKAASENISKASGIHDPERPVIPNDSAGIPPAWTAVLDKIADKALATLGVK